MRELAVITRMRMIQCSARPMLFRTLVEYRMPPLEPVIGRRFAPTAFAGRDSIIYFATNPASVISDLLSASSSSRNFSMSLPVRKIGFSACFSM
jgi:hypothetical protein